MRLIECLDCRTENTVDSRYCRSCGGKLPEDAIVRLKAENHNLIQDAKMLFGDHRFAECKMMVESVLEVEPSNIEALALLGDCYEREGRLHDAIELYEKVVYDRPDSAIDRVRLNHLRKLVEAEQLEVVEPQNHRAALFAGVAGTVLLFSIGAAFLLAIQPAEADTLPTENLMVDASGNQNPQGFGVVSDEGSLVTATPTYNEQSETTENQPEQNEPADTRNETPLRNNGRFQFDPGSRSGLTQGMGGNNPVSPILPPEGITVVPRTNNDPDPTSTIDPGNNNSTSNQADDDGENETQADTGIYEIQVSDGPPKNTGGADDSARSVDALIAKARDLSIQHNYREAIKTYQAALAKGATPASTHQRIAQCYEKLGERDQAIASYRRAADAYRSNIERNGNTSVNANGLRACELAIKNLGG